MAPSSGNFGFIKYINELLKLFSTLIALKQTLTLKPGVTVVLTVYVFVNLCWETSMPPKGDFNAHTGGLSELGRSTNIQGQLRIQLMHRCSLYPVTLSSLTKGPRYTFFRDNTKYLVLLSAAHASLWSNQRFCSITHSTHQTTSQSRLQPNGQQKGIMRLCLHGK